MKEPCLPSLLRMGFGAWMRLGSSGHCPLCLPLKEPAARFGLWEPGFTFHLSSRPMLSSEGAERRGAHPLGPARYDAPPCRAGHYSPGRWCCRVGVFHRTPFPDGAGMSPLSGGGAPDPLPLAGAGWETLRRGVGALLREGRKHTARPGSAAAFKGFGTVPSGEERGERGKVLLCGVKWRLSCRGAGARSPGGFPVIIQAPGRAFLYVKTL